jgi:hypothetical protein
MATNQNPTVRPTTFPEDIEVGKDVPGVAGKSSEIEAAALGVRGSTFGTRRSPFTVRRRTQDRRNQDIGTAITICYSFCLDCGPRLLNAKR